jgi:hypothetical protein
MLGYLVRPTELLQAGGRCIALGESNIAATKQPLLQVSKC